jgi:Ca-activated chloride channel homolog
MARNRKWIKGSSGKPRTRLNPWISFAFWAGVALIAYWTFAPDGDDEVQQAAVAIPAPPLNAAATWAAPEGETLILVGDVPTAPLVSNYYVVFDGSGSMGDFECVESGNKLEAAQDALTRFASAVPDDANLGLLAFDGAGITERVQLGQGNREEFTVAVREVVAGGGTPLGAAIAQAAGRLQTQAMLQRGYGDYNLVVVTDGYAEDPDVMTREVTALLSQTPVTIHTIGFCIDENHALNLPGLVYYRSAMDADELLLGLESVLAESPDFQVTDFDS